MLKNILVGTLFSSVLGVNTFAYDAEKAKKVDQFYSNFTPKALASSKADISADDS